MILRTVEVEPRSSGRESAGVLQAAVAIIVLSVLVAGAHHAPADSVEALNSTQKRFSEQPSGVQRIYRELLSGLEDALRMRTRAGEWPAVERLRRELVPPFESFPQDRWELRRSGGVVNYIGRPSGAGPTFLLLIQENIPHPGTVVLDEFHRKCTDGSLIHVGVWIHPSPEREDIVVAPERRGWTEIVMGR